MMRIGLLALGIAMLLPVASFGQPQRGPLELTSKLGRQLYGLAEDEKLLDARGKLAADPKNLDLMLALSKAQAARRQYREAVATDTAGLALAPTNGALLLERGHLELGLREFAAAKHDLQRAAELTPEVLEVFYHLGLAHYYLGEFAEAGVVFGKARALAKSDDALIYCSNWLYASLRRAGKDAEAEEVLTRITPELKNTDAHNAFYLRLLHFYQGKLSEEEVLPAAPTQPDDLEAELSFDTTTYGVGNWNLYHHKAKRAKELFSKVVQGQAWNTFGFIGSEMELKRLR
jgi:tetratricopeptide (TPR) repeat protein